MNKHLVCPRPPMPSLRLKLHAGNVSYMPFLWHPRLNVWSLTILLRFFQSFPSCRVSRIQKRSTDLDSLRVYVRVIILDTDIDLKLASAALLELHTIRDGWKTFTSLRMSWAHRVASHGRRAIFVVDFIIVAEWIQTTPHFARMFTRCKATLRLIERVLDQV